MSARSALPYVIRKKITLLIFLVNGMCKGHCKEIIMTNLPTIRMISLLVSVPSEAYIQS